MLSSIDSEMSSPPQQPKFTEERQQKIPVTKAIGKNYLNVDILVLIEKKWFNLLMIFIWKKRDVIKCAIIINLSDDFSDMGQIS